MPETQRITRAKIEEIGWSEDWEPMELPDGKDLPVQFNPQTLKVSFSNQKAGGDQKSGAIQFIGRGKTQLSLDLLFDVTVPLADGSMQPAGDVRQLTRDIAYFLQPKEKAKTEKGKPEQFVPPGIRFIWGTFTFEGVMDSMNETLELFSSEGKPLRATVSIAISRQDILLAADPKAAGPGTQPQVAARDGDTIQGIAAKIGDVDDWRALASANDIDNPRILSAGALLKVQVGVSAGVGGASVSAGARVGR